MPELTDEEIEALAAEAELKGQVMADHDRLTLGIAQLRANIEEMERISPRDAKGKITLKGCPPLDAASPANAGKTQYEISLANLQIYTAERDALVAQYPRFFETEEVPVE
jgi:hypothetical protein